MAHLWQMVSDVQLRLADIGERALDPKEIIEYLNHAQYVVSEELYDLDRRWFTTTSNINTTNAVSTYTLPGTILQIERVAYDATGSGTPAQSNEVALRDIGAITGPRQNTILAPTATNPKHSIAGHQITVYPAPTSTTTSGIQIINTRRPVEMSDDRVKFNLTTTSAGATDGSTVIATALSTPNRNDFWNECMIVIKGGTSQYERQIVDDFVTATGSCTMRNAFATQIANSISFDIFDHSIVPVQFHNLIVLYAAAQCALKKGNGALASNLLGQYDGRMDRLHQSRKDVVAVQTQDGEPVGRTNA